MTERQIVAILTAILRAQARAAWIPGDIADCDAIVMQAVATARDGFGETALADAVDTITGGMPPAWDILLDVDAALAIRAAAALSPGAGPCNCDGMHHTIDGHAPDCPRHHSG